MFSPKPESLAMGLAFPAKWFCDTVNKRWIMILHCKISLIYLKPYKFCWCIKHHKNYSLTTFMLTMYWKKFYLSGKATSLCLISKTTQAGKTLLLCESIAHPNFHDTNPVSSQRFQTKNPSQLLKSLPVLNVKNYPHLSQLLHLQWHRCCLYVQTFDWLGHRCRLIRLVSQHIIWKTQFFSITVTLKKLCHCWVLCRINTTK